MILEKLPIEIPEGTSGDWEVKRFTVSKQDSKLDAIRAIASSSSFGRFTPPGIYTKLERNGAVVMSDTPDELRDLWSLKWKAKKGRVLVMGLGLGCAVQMVLGNQEIDCVTVVEKSRDVLTLVGPTLQNAYGNRLTVIEGDAFLWQPPKGQRWEAVWFDIWDDLCLDNLTEMTKLKRKFGKMADWKGCWGEELLRRQERHERKYGFGH